MSNIWFPLPVALFLRRVVNVLSTLSITHVTHHYLFPLPPRSTGADSDKNAQDYTSPSSLWAGRILQSLNRIRQQEAERHVVPLEKCLLDHILQGTVHNFSLNYLWIWDSLTASGKFSVPWFHWPTQLSLFYPASGSRSNGYMEQLNGSTETDRERIPPYSDPNPNPGPSPPGPPDPMDRAGEERQNVDEIHRLIQNPVLYNPLRAPRYPIVLCHGAPLETTT
jgi:triacylglycerol lipase